MPKKVLYNWAQIHDSTTEGLELEAEIAHQLLHVPQSELLGVQAVLARHGHRVRSLSVSSGPNVKKLFFVSKLRIFVISQSVCHW
jgi:hypothetical protein